MKILVIDDEEHILELLKFNLELSGFDVCVSTEANQTIELIGREKPDLLLLDWMLPKISGIDILKKIRQDEDIYDLPVIMLTAKNMEDDKIQGLNVGADDYITKPFSIKELMARINTVLRRYRISDKSQPVIEAGNIVLNTDQYKLTVDGLKVDLTRKEFELLKLLMENRGKVLKRDYLLEKVWGYEFYGETRTVDVHIRHLRKKLGLDETSENGIDTIRGLGYKMK
ncbi:response regulator [Peptostreptococcus stomatis]|uniref:Stage 0 sporulation protein A homolog n=1 Tax=Peptostreptococcus stomatis DSM 17678 TaxID=596315 RepID=E0E3L7_9FIRM|nr:response regulator transcription factor [Peptostreptococcus stomatis]EFM64523.1 response regulator receiver domain protein [Peptostreptococcus stomatis DSM 17678]